MSGVVVATATAAPIVTNASASIAAAAIGPSSVKSIDATDHPMEIAVSNKMPAHTMSVVPAVNNDNDFHYETLDQAVKAKYVYHDEPHSFENSMDFLEDYNHYQFEVLETTV